MSAVLAAIIDCPIVLVCKRGLAGVVLAVLGIFVTYGRLAPLQEGHHGPHGSKELSGQEKTHNLACQFWRWAEQRSVQGRYAQVGRAGWLRTRMYPLSVAYLGDSYLPTFGWFPR